MAKYVELREVLDSTEVDTEVTNAVKRVNIEIEDVTSLQASLSGKSIVGHTHVESEVTDLDKYTVAEVDSLLNGKLDDSQLYTDSDADGRVQNVIKDTVVSLTSVWSSTKVDAVTSGSLLYHGTWNASTNVPNISDATGGNGWYYVVSVGGTQDLGSGDIVFAVGDRVVHNGSIWQWARDPSIVTWGNVDGNLVDQIDLNSRLVVIEDAVTLNTAKVTNVSTNLGVTYNSTEVGVTSSDGTNIIIDPADGTDAGVMTSADKGILDALNGPQTSQTLIGPVPSLKLEVEDGGTAATLQMYDMASPTHLVANMEWLKSTQELIWSLHDKDDGVVKAMMELKPDGKMYVGTGMVQSEVQTIDTRLDAKVFNDMTGNEPAHVDGQIYSANGTLNYDTAYGTTLQLGQEQYIEVVNVTGGTIPNGTPVYFTGLSGGKPAVGLADALQFSTAKVLGVTTMDILDSGSGLVTTFGSVSDMNTNGFTAGNTLYLANGGGFTETPPDIACIVGTVVITDLTAGKMFVRISNFAVFPTVLAYMKGGNAGGTITGTATDVANYNAGSSGSIFLDYSSAAGTITSPAVGLYDVKVNMTITFDETGNQEEDLNLIINASISGSAVIPLKIPRNSTGISFSVTDIVSLVANDVVKIQLSGDAQTGVVYPLMNFTLESKDIR